MKRRKQTFMNHVYKSSQCTDINDCILAIGQLNDLIIIAKNNDLPTKALYKRLLSIEKRKGILTNKK